MVVKKTSRFGAETYTAGTDPHPNRLKFNSETELFDALAAIALQGGTAERPPAGTINRLYWDRDVKRLYWDDGTAWNEITTNGGGGPGGEIVPGTTATEGTSGRSARADHTHLLTLATTAVDGAMSKTDKAKLDGASSVATPGSLVQLDSNGRTQVAAPSAASDASNKNYVDQQTNTRAPSSHTHPATQISDAGPTGINVIKAATQAAAKNAVGLGNVDNTSDQDKPVSTATTAALSGKAASSHTHPANELTGVLAPAQLPAATTAAQGAFSATDKVKLDAASSAATPGTLVQLDASGRAAVQDPAATQDIATKGYTDRALGGKANTTHSHAWADITAKPATFSPTAHTHPWADVTGKPALFPPAAHTHAAGDITGTLAAARLPTATSAAQGAMPAADKTKLDTATPDATPNTLMWRDAWGRTKIADPVGPDDTANKRAIDAAIDTRAPSNHTHTWNSITNIPAASSTTAGTMSAADKAILDSATQNATANTLMWRDGTGRFGMQNPLTAAHGATKSYVDSAINTRAPSSHTHTFSSLQDKEIVYRTNAAVGSYRAVWASDQGIIGHNLSSRKYKANERSYTPDVSLLDVLEPKWFQYKADILEHGSDAAPWRVNFIAEDLHNAGLQEYVSYDGEGTSVEHAETINEQLIVNALWAFAKQQRDQHADLLTRVKALEGKA